MFHFLRRSQPVHLSLPNLQIDDSRRREKLSHSPMSRLATQRRLTMERLENRALLTSLIASVEIAPGPVGEFTEQARTFIESTLEHVMQTQHQSPVASRVDSIIGQASDGQATRITSFTVEFEPLLTGGTAGPSFSSMLLSDAPRLPNSLSNTSSQLEFSFVIYADKTVSARARFTGFQSLNFAFPSLELSSVVSEQFARALNDRLESGRSSDEKLRVYVSGLSAHFTEDELSEQRLARISVTTLDSHAFGDGTANQSSKQVALRHSSADMLLELPEAQLPQPNRFGIDGSSRIGKTNRESSSGFADMSPGAIDAKSAAEISRILSARTTDTLPTTVSLGLIGLQFTDDTFTIATRAAPESASALLQVFIQSPADTQLVSAAPLPITGGAAGWRGHDELEDSLDERWQHASLVILALAGGFSLRAQHRRKLLLKVNKQAATTK